MVFVGPVGAGKSTAVRALSDVAPVDTDVAITAGSADYGDGDKTTTTVGLDYGVWKPTAEIAVSLVGTPGQDRFQDARASILMPNTRVVLWLRADRGDFVADAEQWLTRFAGGLHRLGIAITHAEDDLGVIQEKLADVLSRHDVPVKRVEIVDARDREQVLELVASTLDLPEDAA